MIENMTISAGGSAMDFPICIDPTIHATERMKTVPEAIAKVTTGSCLLSLCATATF